MASCGASEPDLTRPQHDGPRAFNEVPPLHGALITVSGMHAEERAHVRRLVSMLGGMYDESLLRPHPGRPGTTHMLVASRARCSAEKLRAALSWQIPVLSLCWLTECRERQRCADPERFRLC